MEFGDSLNKYQNMQVISADKAETLQDILASIKLQIHIVSLYYAEGKHYAWIVPSRKLKIVNSSEKVKEV